MSRRASQPLWQFSEEERKELQPVSRSSSEPHNRHRCAMALLTVVEGKSLAEAGGLVGWMAAATTPTGPGKTSSQYVSGEDVTLRYTIKNQTNEDRRLLRWNMPLEGTGNWLGWCTREQEKENSDKRTVQDE